VSEESGILIIDDDVDYCCLLQLAFQEAKVVNPTEAVHDGWAAVHHLEQLAPGGLAGIMPGLILLDLRMPGLSGIEVLRWIRNQYFLRGVPVVVFTGLEGGKELAQAIAFGASALHAKPFSYRDLVREAKELEEAYLQPHELKHAA
jgi:CheY-like chemotaxis protein